MREEWRLVPNESRLSVSNFGSVARKNRYGDWKPVKFDIDENGYPRVSVYVGRRDRKRYRVHTLVMSAFVGPRPDDMVVRHRDGNPMNNRLDNLCYGTYAENSNDAKLHGKFPSGENNKFAKLTQAQADEIRTLYASGGQSYNKLAPKYGVSAGLIQKIIEGRAYANL